MESQSPFQRKSRLVARRTLDASVQPGQALGCQVFAERFWAMENRGRRKHEADTMSSESEE